MQSREDRAALMASAALEVEAAERIAEKHFDAVYEAAERSGKVADVTGTAEFRAWMDARAATDAAWGQWAQCMDGEAG